MNQSKRVVIIGNGIAGVTAARYIRKRSDDAITIISAESEYFYSRTALMYVYMGHMGMKDVQPYEPYFWDKNRIELVQAWVQSVDFQAKALSLSSGKIVEYDVLILATGSTWNKFGWPGQDLRGVTGLYSLQDLEHVEEYSKDSKGAVIVGGGLIGIELGEMLHSRHIPVTFLVRENNYWDNVLPKEEAQMVGRHIQEHHMSLMLSTELNEILPDEDGRVRAVLTNKGDVIDCDFVGLTAGVHPNIEFLKNSGLEINRGILVNEYLETNMQDVYAIGDCAERFEALPGRPKIEQVWYTGKMMGETVAMTITGNKVAYDPGIWFNSAKFLDIEYQVYGDVPNQFPQNISTLYWEHPDGRKSIRINYETEGQKVTGFNLMGVRFRHKVCESWLREGRDLEYVLTNLAAANFDPEFYDKHHKDIIRQYNQQSGKSIKPKSKRSLFSMIFNS